MTTNQINSTFHRIAVTDGTGNITGLTVGNITTTGASNLGAPSNITITGGTSGQVLTTDGLGNLSWTSATGGGTGNIASLNLNGNASTFLDGTGTWTAVTPTGGNVIDSVSSTLPGSVSYDSVTKQLTYVGPNEVPFAAVANSVAGANVTGTVPYSAFAGTAYNVAGANVTDTVANANYAAYAGNVVNSAQANITSVGTLTSLSVTGSVVAGSLETTQAAATSTTTVTHSVPIVIGGVTYYIMLSTSA